MRIGHTLVSSWINIVVVTVVSKVEVSIAFTFIVVSNFMSDD